MKNIISKNFLNQRNTFTQSLKMFGWGFRPSLSRNLTTLINNSSEIVNINKLSFTTLTSFMANKQIKDFSTQAKAVLPANDSVKDTEKQNFIMEKWQNDFPSNKDLTYEHIGKLASQSIKIGEWLSETQNKYSDFKDKPQWFTEDLEMNELWSAELRDKLNEAKKLNNELSQKKNAISLKAKQDMQGLNDKYKVDLQSLFRSSPALLIHTFTIQVLPLEIHFKSMTFQYSSESKEFLKQELIKYQKETLEKYRSGVYTIDDLLKILNAKS